VAFIKLTFPSGNKQVPLGLVWVSSHHQGHEEHEGKTIGFRKDAKNAKFKTTFVLGGLCAFA